MPCLAMLMFSACSDKPSDGVLDPVKLEAVLYDYHLAQVMVSDLPSNQRYKKELYFDYIYDKHGITQADVDSSLAYYSRYPEGLSEIYVRLADRIKGDISRLSEEQQSIKVRESSAVVGDSVDLWYDLPIIEMTSSPLGNNRYTFTIPTDTNFKRGDHLAWSGRALFLQGGVDSLHRYLYLDLKIEYMNDSVARADTLLYTSGVFSLVVADSAMVKSIHGSAYLKSPDADERMLMVNPTLMRWRDRGGDSLVVDTTLRRLQTDTMSLPKQLEPSSKLGRHIVHE